MITVVTITYNNFEELISTLESLEPVLIEKEVESLVINGGNCQKTKEYLNTYHGKSISEKDEGIADAFNKGVRNASGDYIAILNSGDLLLNKSYYNQALKHLTSHPENSYVYGKGIFQHSNFGDMLILPEPELILSKMPFFHCSMVISKIVIKECGYFNKAYKIAMDYDLLIRMYKAGHQGYYLDVEPCVLMDGSGISSTNGPAAISEFKEILQKNNLLTLYTKKYLFMLQVKNKVRHFLATLNLLTTYDKIKASLYKRKTE